MVKSFPPIGGSDISAHKPNSRTFLCVRGNSLLTGGGDGKLGILAKFSVDSRSVLNETLRIASPNGSDSISALCLSHDGLELFAANSLTKKVMLFLVESNNTLEPKADILDIENGENDSSIPATYALALSHDDQFL